MTLWVTVMLGSAAAPAQAGLISLYDSFQSSAGTVGDVNSIQSADSFSTGASAVNLTSAQFALTLFGDPTNNPGTLTATLYADNGTKPGSALTTLGTIYDNTFTLGGGASFGTPTVTLATPYALQANTRYWIGLTNNGATTVSWQINDTSISPTVASEFVRYNSSIYTTTSAWSYLMRVNAQPQVLPSVPEPASAVLALIGLSSAVLVARRRSLQVPETV